MISDKFTPHEIARAEELLRQAQHVVILTHMSPDGDAMGSSLGMRHYLQCSYPTMSVTNIVPNAFPQFLAWMPGAGEVLVYDQSEHTSQADRALDEADLIICTDFNEPKRIGALGQRLLTRVEEGAHFLLVDHHLTQDCALSNNPNGLVAIYPDATSASELICRLLTKLTTGLTEQTATCLYTGMMTDTGNFSFNSTYPDLYEMVAELVRMGAQKDAIYNAVFNQYSADRMRLVGYCLDRKMRIYPEHHLALIYLNRKELYQHNFQSGDAEGIVNMPLQIADVHYSVFMREDKLAPWEVERLRAERADDEPLPKCKVKISFRSQGDRPVNIFAHDFFHGGGHANASGGEYYGPVSEAVQLFLDHYKDYLNR